MDLANIKDAKEWFEVLQTSKRTQTAMFENPGRERAMTFNVYSPPEYPPDMKG